MSKKTIDLLHSIKLEDLNDNKVKEIEDNLFCRSDIIKNIVAISILLPTLKGGKFRRNQK